MVDDLTLLSLPFFFLIFSAVELGFGLLLLTLQLLMTRSLDLSLGNTSDLKTENTTEPFFSIKG